MAVLKNFSSFRKHNLEVSKGGIGLQKPNDMRETLEDILPKFCQQLVQIRKGIDEKGAKTKPYDLSIDEAVRASFGMKDHKQMLTTLGIRPGTHTLADLAKVFGKELTGKTAMENLLVDHGAMEFANGSPMGSNDIDATFRFIIPEVFTNAIRTGYVHASMSQNWIASTIGMSQETLTMPMILRGDGMPSRVNEGANIPMGSIAFGKKSVNIFKIGTGFSITDELVMWSQLDLLYIFLQEVGNDMAIGQDNIAMSCLINGEQASLAESAPVVGVIATASGFTYKDLKKVFTRMTRLNTPADRLITGEDDGIDITGIDRFEGFQGQTKLASVRSIIGVPESFVNDVYVMPASQIMFLNSKRAMVKLTMRGLMTERRRNPRNQTEELFISDWINFAIIKRDARVIQDKSVTIGASPFPAYMDVDARINNAYGNL